MKRKFQPIPREKLPEMIGKRIHLSWAYHGITWILDKILGETMYLHTASSGKRLQSHTKFAQYCRRYEPDGYDSSSNL